MKKIIQVTPLKGYNLLLEFDNEEKRLYNMENELTGIFEYLKNPGVFESVTLVNGALTWFKSDELEIDLCPDTVYLESESVKNEAIT